MSTRTMAAHSDRAHPGAFFYAHRRHVAAAVTKGSARRDGIDRAIPHGRPLSQGVNRQANVSRVGGPVQRRKDTRPPALASHTTHIFKTARVGRAVDMRASVVRVAKGTVGIEAVVVDAACAALEEASAAAGAGAKLLAQRHAALLLVCNLGTLAIVDADGALGFWRWRWTRRVGSVAHDVVSAQAVEPKGRVALPNKEMHEVTGEEGEEGKVRPKKKKKKKKKDRKSHTRKCHTCCEAGATAQLAQQGELVSSHTAPACSGHGERVCLLAQHNHAELASASVPASLRAP